MGWVDRRESIRGFGVAQQAGLTGASAANDKMVVYPAAILQGQGFLDEVDERLDGRAGSLYVSDDASTFLFLQIYSPGCGGRFRVSQSRKPAITVAGSSKASVSSLVKPVTASASGMDLAVDIKK